MTINLELQLRERWYRVDVAAAVDLALPLEHEQSAPAFFGADAARADVFVSSDFVGDTRSGGSCNVRSWRITPHCNGTHTESVGHIVDDSVPIGPRLPSQPIPATLVSVAANSHKEIDAAAVAPFVAAALPALVLRTQSHDLRNDDYAVLTDAAMAAIADSAVEHLLIDTPSLDRSNDVHLRNHRRYWGLAENERRVAEVRHPTRTVTEFIHVPRYAADGDYLLCIGCANWLSDAAPSRPVLYPLEERVDASQSA
ncbi:MAG: cyclase family protein [Pseudomonadota bacterium]